MDQNNSPKKNPPEADVPQEYCWNCGQPADFEFLDRHWCVDCYHLQGSVCSGLPRKKEKTKNTSEVC